MNLEVRKWMKHPVHSIKPRDSIAHARELMVEQRINQLPVVVEGRLVGIITDRDLRDAFPSVFDPPASFRRTEGVEVSDPQEIHVELVMTRDVSTIAVDRSMVEAARLMQSQRIGALPVVDGDRLAGIVTRTDVLGCLVALAEIGAEA